MLDQRSHPDKDFNQMKSLTRQLFTYTQNPAVTLHQGVMTFDLYGLVRAPLDKYKSVTQLTDPLENLQTAWGPMNVYQAFSTLLDEFYTGSGGDRPKV